MAAVEIRAVQRYVREASTQLDRLRESVRTLQREQERLGSGFTNEQRFARDAEAMKQHLRSIEREVDRARDVLRSIERGTR